MSLLTHCIAFSSEIYILQRIHSFPSTPRDSLISAPPHDLSFSSKKSKIRGVRLFFFYKNNLDYCCFKYKLPLIRGVTLTHVLSFISRGGNFTKLVDIIMAEPKNGKNVQKRQFGRH